VKSSFPALIHLWLVRLKWNFFKLILLFSQTLEIIEWLHSYHW